MKIGLIGDVHLHSFSRYSHLNTDNNFWIETAFNAIKQAYEEFKKQDIKDVIFLGDLFNVGQSIETGLMNLVHEFFTDLKSRYNMSTYLIAGNHDQKSNGSDDTVLRFLKDVCTCVTYPLIEGDWVMIPYTEDYESLRSLLKSDCMSKKYVFGHLSLDGAAMGVYEYKPKNSMSVKDFEGFKGVYLGHYHKRQNLKAKNNVEYIGSLRALDFGESNDGDKGFCILDTDISLQTQLFKLDVPDFSITDSVDDKINFNNSIVRYDYHGTIDEDGIRKELMKKGVLHVEFNKLDTRSKEERVVGSDVKSDMDYLNYYVENNGQGFDKNKLLKVGIECLELQR